MHYANIYPLLAIKLQERNRAYGIAGVTPQVTGLLELYGQERHAAALADLAQTEMSLVDLGVMEFEQIKEAMKAAPTLEEKNDLYRRARELLGEVAGSVETLETIGRVD